MSSLLSAGLLYLTETAGEPVLKDKIFALDWQLIFDALIVACAVFFLFFLLSYLVFNPARNLMQKRRDKIAEDIAAAEKEKEDALVSRRNTMHVFATWTVRPTAFWPMQSAGRKTVRKPSLRKPRKNRPAL